MSHDSESALVASPFRNIRWLYNNNPFYIISTVLMLFAVWKGFGELSIGSINSLGMMLSLMAYTTLLAVIGIIIVRLGKVWEDARSILVLILLLFVAISISLDDLFARTESWTVGTALMAVGYIFAAILTETVFWLMKLRLGILFRIPFHLILALFFIAPWWSSPELHPRPLAELEWLILLFPVAAAGIALLLLPAVRQGPKYTADNGSPWTWAWYPWTAFVMLGVAVIFRSYTLSMTFAPVGPIWIGVKGDVASINFDTLWAPYFLIPFAWACQVLLSELALSAKHRDLSRWTLASGPALILAGLPLVSGPVGYRFYQQVTGTIGSPVWLALILCTLFYFWSTIRQVEHASSHLLASLLGYSVIGPRTVGVSTLTSPELWPFLVLGGVLLWKGLQNLSSRQTLAGVVCCTVALWLWLPGSDLAEFRFTISVHVLWVAVILTGLIFQDSFSKMLRQAGAVMVPLALGMIGGRHADLPPAVLGAYVLAVLAFTYAIAMAFKDRWYLWAFLLCVAAVVYGILAIGFRAAVQTMGAAAMTSALWSAGSLVLAVLISAHKARWIPDRLLPRWGSLLPSALNRTKEPTGQA